MWFLDVALQGSFRTYGYRVLLWSLEEASSRADPMILLFPRYVLKSMLHHVIEKHGDLFTMLTIVTFVFLTVMLHHGKLPHGRLPTLLTLNTV